MNTLAASIRYELDLGQTTCLYKVAHCQVLQVLGWEARCKILEEGERENDGAFIARSSQSLPAATVP
jgi:hypothetical protein